MTSYPGPIVLLGSGETSPSGRTVFDWVFARAPQPPRLAIVETPAGFQPNSALVAADIARFLAQHLQNYRPEISVIPARKRGTAFSPDAENIVAPMRTADVLFLGPGSPTYAVRQLRHSLAWEILRTRHQSGAAVVLASAAVIAASTHVLPVYEIFKAGADLHWQPGLGLLEDSGLSLTFVPHWNNNEGGGKLDTSRCFMGQERFAELRSMLPADATIVGIDEHTALIIDLAIGSGQVRGRGSVTLLRQSECCQFEAGACFALERLGSARFPAFSENPAAPNPCEPALTNIPAVVQELVQDREEARRRRQWQVADDLRCLIAAHGWVVRDTPAGPELQPK